MSFFVTLPSNGSDLLSSYGLENNTQTDFYTDLKEPLDLNEDFEVALVEYSYRKNWMIDIVEIIVHKWNASDLNEIYRCTISVFDGLAMSEVINEIKDKTKSEYLNIWLDGKKLKLHVPYGYEIEFKGYFATRLKYGLAVTKNQSNIITSKEIESFLQNNVTFKDFDSFYIIGKKDYIVQCTLESEILKYVEEIFVCYKTCTCRSRHVKIAKDYNC